MDGALLCCFRHLVWRVSGHTHTQTVTLLSTPTPPVEFWDTHRQTHSSNITVHTDPPGRVLGHTQTDSNITDCPHRHPRSSFGTQTDRQTVYMGEELGNYVHQNLYCTVLPQPCTKSCCCVWLHVLVNWQLSIRFASALRTYL